MSKQIVCSFSGGETSAYMAIKLKEKNPDTAFVFANTGEENEETLEFVDKESMGWLMAMDNYKRLGAKK